MMDKNVVRSLSRPSEKFWTLVWCDRGIVRPVKRDWAVLSKDTPMDISI